MQNNHLIGVVVAMAMLGSVILGEAPIAANAQTSLGSLTYHKVHQTATIGSNYASFKLTNHVINSDYPNIKTTSWQKSGLKAGTQVTIDMTATQGTQYNWYRISKTAAKPSQQKKAPRYWIYGQALQFPNLTVASSFN